MVRYMGIEPTPSAWKADALTVTPIPLIPAHRRARSIKTAKVLMASLTIWTERAGQIRVIIG